MTHRRLRARELGIVIGTLPPGRWNAITDVPGVRVGHVTLIEGEAGPLQPGRGPVRTGVTAIIPHDGDIVHELVHGITYCINGYGEVTNVDQVAELGVIEGPILLTNTFSVPMVEDAVMQWMEQRDPDIGVRRGGVSPVVAECNDSWLNDIRGRHVRPEHVFQAIENATAGPVAEGNVGGGTGMSCFELKGGIGTASRVLPESLGGYTVGVLVQSNFGRRPQLRVDGVPVGRELADWHPLPEPPVGNSIVIVLATDAPLIARQLRRLAVRCGAGLARTGSTHGASSGDFVISFSTAERVPLRPSTPTLRLEILPDFGPATEGLFQAAIEATEEAILNALCMAETMRGRDGHVRHALPLDRLVEIMRRYGHSEVHLPEV
ncbi:MAG: P1 family peptidase [Anaerolineae bacterium]|nr:P1 family peptidase [Anaerolineae bacterium]